MPLLVPPRALRDALPSAPRRLEVRATDNAIVFRAALGGGAGAIASYSMPEPGLGRIAFADGTEAALDAPTHAKELSDLWSRTRWVSDLVLRTRNAEDYRPTPQEQQIADLFVSLDRGEELLRGVSPFVRALDAKDWTSAVQLADEVDEPAWIAPFARAFDGHAGRVYEHANDERRLEGHLATFRGLGRRELHLLEGALDDLAVGATNLPNTQRADHYAMVAEIAHLLGDRQQAIQLLAWSLPLSADDDAFVRSTNQLLRFGGYGEAERALERRCRKPDCSAEIWLLRARLALWCGRSDDARDYAARADANSPDTVLIHGIAAALDGDDDAALAHFGEIAHLELREAHAWSAEIVKRRGEAERSVEHLEIACLTAQNAVHTLLRCIVYDEMQDSGRAQLAAQEGIVDEHAQTLEAVAAALRTFQGNRSASPSRTPTAEPVRSASELELVPIPPGDMLHTSRNEAAELLKEIRIRPVEEIHAEFGRLQERYPESAHPYCYWGELHLWEGHYEDAYAAFNATPAARIARWGFVGRAAVEVHRGDFDAALEEFSQMASMYEPVRGATTHVYLGELHRIRGEYEQALHELDISLGAKPGRIGAHINRVLCLASTGDTTGATRDLQTISNRWPNLFWHACQAVGVAWDEQSDAPVEVCEAALRLMRGNRSSHLHTFYDRSGDLRFTVDADAWTLHFERCRTHLRLGALESLLGGVS